MHIALEYTLDQDSYLSYYEAAGPAGLKVYRNNHLRWGFYVLAVVAAGLVASIEARNALLVFVLAAIFIAQIVHAASYARHYRKYLRTVATTAATKHIRLEIGEEGLRESVEGLESFAPWSCVRSYKIGSSVLVLELTAAMSSIIPLSAFTKHSTTALPEFVELLHSKSISKQ